MHVSGLAASYRVLPALVSFALLLPASASGATPERATVKPRLQHHQRLVDGQLPLVFEENRGQVDARVAFLSRGLGYDIFLTRDAEAWLVGASGGDADSGRRSVRLRLAGARNDAAIHGLDPLAGKISYFHGNDPEKWQRGVSTFARARYAEVYPGIDWVFHPNAERLEYDFVVAPGADPATIALVFDDPLRPEATLPRRLAADGSLVLDATGGAVTFDAPVLYQTAADGRREPVDGRYELRGDQVGFVVGDYDRMQPLVIDPILRYGSYLGGTHQELVEGVAFDAEGNIYLNSMVFSNDFPTTPGVIQPTASAPWNIAITKLDPTASEILYSTYVGGAGQDRYSAIQPVSDGLLILIGLTTSTDLPMVNAYDDTLDGTIDLALVKLSPDGTEVQFSTYFGGSDFDMAATDGGVSGYAWIAVDGAGRIFIAGQSRSDDLPVTVNALQPMRSPGNCLYGEDIVPCPDPFVTVFAPDGQSLVYSTYWGTVGDEGLFGVLTDAEGFAYIQGGHFRFGTSLDGPPGSLPTVQALYPDPPNATGGTYVAKLPIDGSPPVFATYFAGNGGEMGSVFADAQGRLLFSGITFNCANLPLLHSLMPCLPESSSMGYAARLNARGTGFDFFTILGGAGDILIANHAPLGNMVLSGTTSTSEFPLVNPDVATLPSDLSGAISGFLHDTGPTLLFSTVYGGLITATGNTRYGPKDTLWLTGFTTVEDLPLPSGAVQPTPAGTIGVGFDEGFFAAFQTQRAALATPSRVPVETGQGVEVPVTLVAGGLDLASVAFVLEVPPCLEFDPTDGNSDGIPDAITLTTPPGFVHTITWNAGDDTLDVAIFDPSPPLATLPTSQLLTIAFTATCNPPTGVMDVPLPFSTDPAPSYGLVTGFDAPGDALDGSVRIFGGLRGDCNGSGAVNAADLPACVLEAFDNDGPFWLDAGGSTFPGRPYGCDANGDTAIDAGDLSCKLLLIFGGTCGGAPLAGEPPRLSLPAHLNADPGTPLAVPVELTSADQSVVSVLFSLDLPERLVTFDPTDADADGIPDAVTVLLPPGFQASVRYEPGRRFGELLFAVVPPAGGDLDDGPLFVVHLEPSAAPTQASGKIRFGSEPPASWGGAFGESLPGTADDETVVVHPGIFYDGFESGNLDAWSASIP